jgi:hypothetical protein
MEFFFTKILFFDFACMPDREDKSRQCSFEEGGGGNCK